MKINALERGDIVTINLNPTRGHEQKGIRPALILSHHDFNVKTGLAIVCPISSKIKGSPFEIKINGQHVMGVILAHQVKTIDWVSRVIKICDHADEFCLSEVIRKLTLIIS